MAGGSAAASAAAKAQNSWLGAKDIAEVKDMQGPSNSSSSSDDAKSRGTTHKILSRDSKKLSSSSSSPKPFQLIVRVLSVILVTFQSNESGETSPSGRF